MATYDDYRKMLPVQKHRLDDELETHADILERVGSECARLESRSRELKSEAERVEARAYLQLREDDVKRTADELRAKVATSRDVVRAQEAHEIARLEWQRWEKLYDAWKLRDFSVRALGKLFGDGYFANDPIVSRERGRRDADYLERRDKMRKASQEAGGDMRGSLEGAFDAFVAAGRRGQDDEERPARRRADA
jgi:hypothetical protein